jgi:hypothetical protein
MSGGKRCWACGETKPVEAFNRNRSRHDGRQTRCRACENAAGRAWKAAHRESMKAYSRQYYHEHRDHMREKSREWTRRSQDRVRAAYFWLGVAVALSLAIRPAGVGQPA